MTHAISWVELPAIDYDRATEFYATVLDREITEYEDDSDAEGRYGIVETEEDEIGCAIAAMDEFVTEDGTSISYAPGDEGPMIYLTIDGSLEDALERVEPAGGVVMSSKAETGEGGYYGVILDTEGNRVGLFSSE